MNTPIFRWLTLSNRRTAAAIVAVVLATALPVRAEEDGARKVLKAMSDYMASQANLSFKFNSDLEVITPDLQKIQFSASGDVLLSRPDKIRITRTGGYADVELAFDGKMVSVVGKSASVVAQLDASGTVDTLIDRLRNEFLIEIPGADLLMSNVYGQLIEGVIDAKHVGRGVVEGVECEHLAFRNEDTDWQLWVEVGDRPIPRKYVITSKTVAAAPQYTLRTREWKTDVKPEASAFVLKLPDGSSKVGLEALNDIDEVPAGMATGGKK